MKGRTHANTPNTAKCPYQATILNTSCVALYRFSSGLMPSYSSTHPNRRVAFDKLPIFLEDEINQNTSKQNAKLVHVPRA